MDETVQDPTPSELADRARIEVQEPLDRQLAPLGRRAIQALAPVPGERVLDIGCGAGHTLIDLARAVGPGGQVLGVDISDPMLGEARRRTADLPNVACLRADAQGHPFEPAAFDAAFSRFGVMFFADPAAAFANIRRALKPGDRLAFVCWRAFEDNELDHLPLRAAAPHLPPGAAEAPAPDAFSFADPDTVRRVLAEAGFGRIAVEPHDQPVASGSLDAMLAVCLRVGPLGRFLRENPQYRDAATPAVRTALAARPGPEGPALDAATWIVTARNGSDA